MTCVYQADPDTVQTLHRIRDTIRQCCSGCLNRQVRVQTVDGQIIEGTVTGVDHRYLYVSVPDSSHYRTFFPGFYNPASQVILPLVLYELLVITLLS